MNLYVLFLFHIINDLPFLEYYHYYNPLLSYCLWNNQILELLETQFCLATLMRTGDGKLR